MFRKKMFLMLTGIMLLNLSAFAAEQPYKGQHQRDIKALSAKEASDLMDGKGMGFAKAAELNHYPGPRHLLDEKAKMGLSPDQIKGLEKLFSEMQNEARKIGSLLVAKEREIDRLFKSGKAQSGQLRKLVKEAGEIRSQLRFAHLNTHIKTRSLLSEEQIRHYDLIRGYSSASDGGHSHHH